jgi:hypothetical protein
MGTSFTRSRSRAATSYGEPRWDPMCCRLPC